MDKARGAWWNSSSYELPSSLTHKNTGRSASVNVTSVLSPTTTNEVLFTFSKLKLDIFHADPERVSLTALGFPNFTGPWGHQTDTAPVNLINTWSQNVGDLWDPVGQDIFAYNSSLMFTDTLTKVLNTHALKAGLSVERARKDQNFQNNETVEFIYSNWGNGTTGNVFGDTITARPSEADFRHGLGDRQLPALEHRLLPAGLVEGQEELHARVRRPLLQDDEQRRAQRPRRLLRSRRVQHQPGLVPRRQQDLHERRRATPSSARSSKGLIDSRPIYLMPRVNFAYDVEGNGDLIVRGGAGPLLQPADGQRRVRRHPLLAVRLRRRQWTPGRRRTTRAAY